MKNKKPQVNHSYEPEKNHPYGWIQLIFVVIIVGIIIASFFVVPHAGG